MNSIISNSSEPTILIVDDNLDNLKLLSDMLRKSGYKTRRAISGSLALQALTATEFDLILLDITMPEMNGYTVCKKIKANPQFTDIPVIFISALNDVIDKVKAFEVGGIDYITKPFQMEEVTARVANQMRIIELQKKLKIVNHKLQQKNQQLEVEQQKIKQSHARIVKNSLKDPLTNFDTKISFTGQLRQLLKNAGDNNSYNFALVIIQDEQFKLDKSVISEQAFKKCLIAISKKIVEVFPDSSIFGYLDDTEFGIAIADINKQELLTKITEEIRPKLSFSLSLEEREIFFNPNYGIVMGQQNYQKPEQMLYDAKNAVAHSLSGGYGNYQLFDREIEAKTFRNLQLRTKLKQALKKQDLRIHYRPIINLNTNKISGLNTYVFYPFEKEIKIEIEQLAQIAFDIGLMNQLNDLLWHNICGRIKKLQEAFIWREGLEASFAKDFQVRIKVATIQFLQPDFIQQIRTLIKKFNLETEVIALEFTTRIFHPDCDLAIDKIKQLRKLGINLSLDCLDICYLPQIRDRSLPINNLTLVPELLSNLATEEKDRAISHNIIELARNLDLTVIATGVSNSQQLEILKEQGCDFAMGTYISELVKPQMKLID